MIIQQGKAVSGGIAEGIIEIYDKRRQTDQPAAVETEPAGPEAELCRYHQAKEEAARQLAELYRRTAAELGAEEAGIFRAQELLVRDPNYEEAVRHRIMEGKEDAAAAVLTAGKNFSRIFAAMKDEYMRARAADVEDVAERLASVLSGGQAAGQIKNSAPRTGGSHVILLAEDLTPSETVQMDRSRIAGFVTLRGSAYSHTAILARTMNIPAVAGLNTDGFGHAESLRHGDRPGHGDRPRHADKSRHGGFPSEWDGKAAILDGENGYLYIEPTPEIREKLLAQAREQESRRERLSALKGKENRTLDGRTIEIYANIGSVEDAEAALANDAGGIGLFRSEFLYLERTDYPGEEEQFRAYRAVAEKMASGRTDGGRPVIIRTLDIGADKQADYFGLEREENPAMGYRAIRICLDRKELFRTQLRAILRASRYGRILLMLPMITSLEEVREAKELIEEAGAELGVEIGSGRREAAPGAGNRNKEDGRGRVELGIMIETPAAALISDRLAQEVDFFSIGTNDLTQYTLAIDRQNPRLERYYHPHHEAVLRLIRLVAENGRRAGCRVGICGELAADLTLTEEWLRIGIDELSVPPAMVLPLREKIRGCEIAGEEELPS